MNSQIRTIFSEIYFHSCVGIDDALLVFGGFSNNEIRLRDIHLIDASTRKWRSAGELQKPSSSSFLHVSGNDIFVIRGFGGAKHYTGKDIDPWTGIERLTWNGENMTDSYLFEQLVANDNFGYPMVVEVPYDFCMDF